MELIRSILLGLGCLSILWLGSCTLMGVGTVVAVNSVATTAGKKEAEYGKKFAKYRDEYEYDEWAEEDVTRNRTTHFENHH